METRVGKPQAWAWVARFSILFAAVGLLLGFGEAAQLYLAPRWPLLEPDITYAIWFVAPLADLSLAACVGLVLGLLVAERHLRGISQRLANLAAALLGAASALSVVALASRLALKAWEQGLQWCNAALWTSLAFAGFLLAGFTWRKQILRLIQHGSQVHFRRLAAALLTATAALLGGLTVYTFHRAFPLATVRASTGLPGDRPNIVLITLDTARADHLSLYGYPRPTTPNLERWARQGVVFENAITPSSWTLASLASIMTGSLPHQHGADWESPVRGKPWTLAKILHSDGYETAAFNANLFYSYAGWGLRPGFEVFDDDSSSLRHNLFSTLAGQTLLQPLYSLWVRPDRLDRRSGRQVNQDVFRWLQHNPQRPYFLYVNYFDAHEPFLAPAPYDHRFGRASNGLIDKATELMREGASPQALSGRERASLIASYDNCLASLDGELNRLLTFLASRPEWPNTLVIITADHGEAFGEHGTYGHGWNLYREVLHVPLVVLGPGVPAGARIERPVATRKLFATVLDLALGGQEPFASHSLRALWAPGAHAHDTQHVIISELFTRVPPRANYLSAFTAQWHYWEDSAGRKGLYDWTHDPEERINLADQQPEIVADLTARLRTYAAESVRPWRAPQYVSVLGLDAGWNTAKHEGGPPRDPIGICQAHFPRDDSRAVPREIPDEDLLRSLPYD